MHAKFHIDPFNRLATLHQRYRQQKQTGQTDRHDRQRSDSIGRTVLQTIAQKLCSWTYMSKKLLFWRKCFWRSDWT